MTNRYLALILLLIIVAVGIFIFFQQRKSFNLPSGKPTPLEQRHEENTPKNYASTTVGSSQKTGKEKTSRQIFTTDDTFHSIPLNEILSGGPGKDSIPSIDTPKFISTSEADSFLEGDDIGLGFIWKGEARFYPYKILVWHEIVNDIIAKDPILITYCPLCATGVVFERRIGGQPMEFGVSGLLWQSNLLMYNRTENPDTESLWSQVLGEAVVGPKTGTKLNILPADTVRYGEWKQTHSNTRVLSQETGTIRNYNIDPYEGYYTSESVSFGATFNDDRLHPKALVLGIEKSGKFKAYHEDALPIGITADTFAGIDIIIEKNKTGEVRMFTGTDKKSLPFIRGFWFSWLAVHPQTELYK